MKRTEWYKTVTGMMLIRINDVIAGKDRSSLVTLMTVLKRSIPPQKEERVKIITMLEEMVEALSSAAPIVSSWVEEVIDDIKGYDLEEQQSELHPIVNAIDLVLGAMASSKLDTKADLLRSVEDLPENLRALPWVKKVHSAYLKLRDGLDQTSILKTLLQEGRGTDILPKGYLT